MAVSVVESDAGNNNCLNLPSLAMSLVQFRRDKLDFPRHRQDPLSHRPRSETLVKLLLDTRGIVVQGSHSLLELSKLLTKLLARVIIKSGFPTID